MDIIEKTIETLKENFSEEELIELSDRLDGDPGYPILEALNEHLSKVRPDLYCSLEDFLKENACHTTIQDS